MALKTRHISLASILLAACSGPDPVDEQPVDEAPVESIRADVGSAVNLSGTWARLVVTTAESSAPLVGTVVTTNSRVFLDHVTHDGSEVQVQSLICDMDVETSTGMASTVVPDAFVEAVGSSTWTATIDAGSLHSPVSFDTLGVADIGPEDELPTGADDPRVVDPDGDGHPGMTIEVTGIAGGEMYFVQRGWREFRSTQLTGTTIDGGVEWDATRVVLDATSRALRNARPAVPTDSASENYFRMTRVSDEATCVEILAEGRSLFAR